MITSALPSRTTGIARSWISRNSSHPCCQIHRRMGSLRRSKLEGPRSEAEACQFVIGAVGGSRVILLDGFARSSPVALFGNDINHPNPAAPPFPAFLPYPH